MTTDPYWKLKPQPPTPENEICTCRSKSPYLLQYRLGCNPIVCLGCRGEVEPERSGFTPAQADTIADWNTFYSCFFLLWIDSAEFEVWARAELEIPGSPVNLRSLALVPSLSETHPIYFSWFESPGEEGWEPLSACPVCGAGLRKVEELVVCDRCRAAGCGPRDP